MGGLEGGWVCGWLENEFLKKTPSPKFELESHLGTSDFGVCQKGQKKHMTWSILKMVI